MSSDNECKHAFERISKLHPKLIDLSLERIEELLGSFDNPQDKLNNVFHIAGTNGKGSVTAYLTAIAQAWGKTVNVMTSPHLISVTERFRVLNKLITLQEVDQLLEEIITKNNDRPLTIFEALTTLGFLAFSRSSADINVIETGLGGRFDATNVVKAPKASLITPISFDHQNFLGNSIEEIAAEKAGIIKKNVPIFSSCNNSIAIEVLRTNAEQNQAPFFQIGEDFNAIAHNSKMIFQDGKDEIELDLPALEGTHQIENAALAIMAFKYTLSPPNTALCGIKNASWPGRIQQLHGKLSELLPKNANLWVDGAHNPDGSLALQRWLEKQPNNKVHLLFACSQGREAISILKPLLPFAQSIHLISEPKQQNAQPADLIKSNLKENGVVVTSAPMTLEQALKEINSSIDPHEEDQKVLIVGSLYLAGVALEKDQFQFI